jgi:hypothetical protein
LPRGMLCRGRLLKDSICRGENSLQREIMLKNSICPGVFFAEGDY